MQFKPECDHAEKNGAAYRIRTCDPIITNADTGSEESEGLCGSRREIGAETRLDPCRTQVVANPRSQRLLVKVL